MASTKFIAHGFLGYEVIIKGSVQTNVLFAVADEKQTLLAWYGFKSNPDRGHGAKFDGYDMGVSGAEFKPEMDCDFATRDSAGKLNVCLGRLTVAGLVPSGKGRVSTVQADLIMGDLETGMTACLLSIPSVQPAGLLLACNLRPMRKRRTFDDKKPGTVKLISVQQFSRIALENGPSPAILRTNTVFRGKGSKQLCP
jgi:hypothetical protein